MVHKGNAPRCARATEPSASSLALHPGDHRECAFMVYPKLRHTLWVMTMRGPVCLETARSVMLQPLVSKLATLTQRIFKIMATWWRHSSNERSWHTAKNVLRPSNQGEPIAKSLTHTLHRHNYTNSITKLFALRTILLYVMWAFAFLCRSLLDLFQEQRPELWTSSTSVD